jgi:hypothetical protein
MNRKLLKLSKSLNALGMPKESKNIVEIFKAAQIGGTIQEWDITLKEATDPVPEQLPTKAVKYVIKGAIGLYQASQGVQGLSQAELKKAIELAEKMPKVKASNGYNYKQIKKLADKFNKIFPEPNSGHIKNAQLETAKSLLGGAAQLGGMALRVVPFIGVIFSGMLAFKNLIYGFWAYRDLAKESVQIGLHWTETLFPQKIEEKVAQNSNDPEKLTIASKVSKLAKVFVDEAISFVANFIDAIKDLMFAFINAAFFTLTTGLDIGLSFVIMAIEWWAEGKSLAPYSNILNSIADMAKNKIAEFSKSFDWEKSLSKEDLDKYLAELI